MSDYHRKYPAQYRMERNLYIQTRALVSRYDYLRIEYMSIIEGEASALEGMPKGNGISNPTLDRAIKAETIGAQIRAIESAYDNIPEEYRKGVWNNVTKGKSYPEDANRSTYGRHKARFLYSVAKNLHWI